MKALDRTLVALAGLALIGGCGGGGKKSKGSTTVQKDPEPDSEPASEPQPENKKKPPKTWHAKAALTPVKGAKLKPAVVSFSQQEGEDTNVEADALDGVKPGKYWLVVHDSDTCGPNATKTGPAWQGGAEMAIVIKKDLTGGLDQTEVTLPLDGDSGAIGHLGPA